MRTAIEEYLFFELFLNTDKFPAFSDEDENSLVRQLIDQNFFEQSARAMRQKDACCLITEKLINNIRKTLSCFKFLGSLSGFFIRFPDLFVVLDKPRFSFDSLGTDAKKIENPYFHCFCLPFPPRPTRRGFFRYVRAAWQADSISASRCRAPSSSTLPSSARSAIRRAQRCGSVSQSRRETAASVSASASATPSFPVPRQAPGVTEGLRQLLIRQKNSLKGLGAATNVSERGKAYHSRNVLLCFHRFQSSRQVRLELIPDACEVLSNHSNLPYSPLLSCLDDNTLRYTYCQE